MSRVLDSSKIGEILLPGATACEEAFNKAQLYWVYGEGVRTRSFSTARGKAGLGQSFDGPYTRSYELPRPWGSGENGKLIHVSGFDYEWDAKDFMRQWLNSSGYEVAAFEGDEYFNFIYLLQILFERRQVAPSSKKAARAQRLAFTETRWDVIKNNRKRTSELSKRGDSGFEVWVTLDEVAKVADELLVPRSAEWFWIFDKVGIAGGMAYSIIARELAILVADSFEEAVRVLGFEIFGFYLSLLWTEGEYPDSDELPVHRFVEAVEIFSGALA